MLQLARELAGYERLSHEVDATETVIDEALCWNKPAISFYESLGASVLPDWRVCRVVDDALRRMADRA